MGMQEYQLRELAWVLVVAFRVARQILSQSTQPPIRESSRRFLTLDWAKRCGGVRVNPCWNKSSRHRRPVICVGMSYW